MRFLVIEDSLMWSEQVISRTSFSHVVGGGGETTEATQGMNGYVASDRC